MQCQHTLYLVRCDTMLTFVLIVRVLSLISPKHSISGRRYSGTCAKQVRYYYQHRYAVQHIAEAGSIMCLRIYQQQRVHQYVHQHMSNRHLFITETIVYQYHSV